MKKLLLFTGLFFCLTVLGQEYEIKSDYLLHPEKNIELVKAEADFWKNYKDDISGGFFSGVNEQGTIDDSRKYFSSQAFLAYVFSKAYALTGDEEYLNLAGYALDFMYKYGWDTTYGGWYASVSADGTDPRNNPVNNSNERDTYLPHAVLLGITSMVEITRDSIHLEWMNKALNFNYNVLWDDDPVNYGYYNNAPNSDWNSHVNKGLSTLNALEGYAVNLPFLTEDTINTYKLLQLDEDVLDHFVGDMDNPVVSLGFPVWFHDNWSIIVTYNTGFFGAMLGFAKDLAESYLVFGDNRYLNASLKIMDEVWDHGYDKFYGGIYNSFNWSTGLVLDMSKYPNDFLQCVSGGLFINYASDLPLQRDRGLQMADQSLDFFSRFFIDSVYGGTYSTTARNGEPTDPEKGYYWKTGDDAVGIWYNAYLSGRLLLQQDTASLYYRFSAEDQQREIQLTPLAIENNNLIITSVEKDGASFANFDPVTRTITLVPMDEGKFKVTFKNIRPAVALRPQFVPDRKYIPVISDSDKLVHVPYTSYAVGGDVSYSLDVTRAQTAEYAIDTVIKQISISVAKGSEGTDSLYITADDGVSQFTDFLVVDVQQALPNRFSETQTDFPEIIYPNPAHDLVRLKGFKTIATVRVLDLSTGIIKKLNVNVGEIDISGLAPGTYLMEVNGPNGVQSFGRFVKL